MARPVPLIRRFTPISRSYQDHGVTLEDIWPALGHGERVEWGQLRDIHRAVILADAGAGKTYELKAEAERLVARGRAAFFIRIEDIDAEFGAAFEVGSNEAFVRWLAGTEEAWFFLDSVDEVRLETPRAFETAMRAFAARVHDARQRAHVYISSRPYAWRPKRDRALIEELLPFDTIVGERTGENRDQRFAGKDEDKQSALQLYQLAPLDRDDIRIFAGHRGISDANALIEALERANLFGLAQLPFDLEDMLAIWQESRSFNSRLAVLEHGLSKRLAPPVGAPATLSLDRALEGARQLALATTLTGETNISSPGSTGGLDATLLLDNWSEADIRELLGRGVFSDAIYAMVRFRHRETRELLAAQALGALTEHPGGQQTVESMIFRNVYGEEVIVPRLRPLLPWLILINDPICARTVALDPELLTESGDPARLPQSVRQKMLHDIVAGIVSGNMHGSDNSAIARIAQADLTDQALALIDAYGDNDAAIFFLGRLVWQGTMRAPAERLLAIAKDRTRGIYARIASVRAVAAGIGADATASVWAELNTGEILSRRLLTELVDSAAPNISTVNLLLRSLDTLEPYDHFGTAWLNQAIHGLIERLPLTSDRAPEQPLARLVEGLAEFLARAPYIERRECQISEQFRWLFGSAMHAVERLIIARSQACFGPSVMTILSRAPALRHWGGSEDHEHKTKLGELVPRWTELNDALFWHTVAAARSGRKGDDKPLIDDWDVTWIGHFWSYDAASFPRTRAWITARDLADDRSVALSRSFRTYVQNGRHRAWRQQLWQAVKGHPALEAKLATLMRPPASPDRKRWRAQERKWSERRRRQDNNQARWRAQMVARLKANPDLVRAPPRLKPGDMSYDQLNLLQSIKGDGLHMTRGGGARWQTLIPEFGEAVAEAFCDSALAHWRAYQPKLRSENGNSSTIPYALIFAMAGLEIEAGADGLGLAKLDREEAAHALRYAVHELNGLPTWFEPLYRAYPDLGFGLVWGELCWELESSVADQPMHYILHDLVYHAPWLHAELAQPIHDWLAAYGTANADCLRYGRTIMVSGGLAPDYLASLAQTRIAGSTTPASQLASWFALWVDVSPDVAIPALAAKLAAMSQPDDARFAEQFVVGLIGGRHESGPTIGTWRTPSQLKSLYVLMHRHIRRAEDTDRPSGEAYSPTFRDDAQDARQHLFSLLADIPGEATYREVLALAADHPEPDYRTHMKRKAYERAVVDSDQFWTLEDVKALSIGAPHSSQPPVQFIINR